MGTIHGTEIFAIVCPDISRDTASDIAAFLQGLRDRKIFGLGLRIYPGVMAVGDVSGLNT